MNTCQIIFLSVIIAASADETPRWTGPFADHKLGQLVQDTPEVAAAKIYHNQAHTQIRAILPELPPEERFPTAEEEAENVPQIRQVIPEIHQVPQVIPEFQRVVPQVRQVVSPPVEVSQYRPVIPEIPRPVEVPQVRQVIPETPRTVEVPQQLAEEIPRSPLGEVPEVEAARKAHLKAILEAVALNQRLGGDEPSSTFLPPVRPLVRRNGPIESPEVAAARVEHARAVAALAAALRH